MASILGLMLIWLGTLTGCGYDPFQDVDSFMDPSVVGRWENTPVTLPILERLEVIEEPIDVIEGACKPNSEDLIPTVREYVLGPGDVISINIFELLAEGVEARELRRIDALGYVRLPVIGRVKAGGLTISAFQQLLIDKLQPEILRDPQVTVIVEEGRQKTFSIIGAAAAVGTYSLFKSDFRLLDAIALARGIPESTQMIYIIRQEALKPIVRTGRVYDQFVEPRALVETEIQTTSQPAQPKPARPVSVAVAVDALPAGSQWRYVDGRWVKLTESSLRLLATQPATQPRTPTSPARVSASVPRHPSAAPTSTGDPSTCPAAEHLPPPGELVSQRVIQIPAGKLLKGMARYNIVIRPGDIIRVPQPVSGVYFIGGQINRPGTYNLPPNGGLTVKQAVIAAGGLNPVAIPERVDLVRRVGPACEATLRLNLRAIFEGSVPDIYLKPHDTLNVGTNMSAPFIAVLRNSFRSTYGFGFVLDKNFLSD